MSPTRWVSWGAVAFLALLVSARGFASSVEDPPKDPAKMFAELQAEFEKAQEEFFAPYQAAKTEEEAAKIVLDFTKEPGVVFGPKFLAFANEHEGTKAGADALMAYMSMTRGDRDAVAKAAARFVELYADSASGKEFARSLPMFGWMLGSDKVEAYATALLEKSTDHETKAWALFARAQTLMTSAKERARADFDVLLKDYEGTEATKRAEGTIFEMENLQVGMVAPDFETTDQDGKPWKLSDYRGKVVVIDFWGFW